MVVGGGCITEEKKREGVVEVGRWLFAEWEKGWWGWEENERE